MSNIEIQTGNTLVDQARKLHMVNSESYLMGGSIVEEINEYIKRVTDYWEPMAKASFHAWKDIVHKRDEMLEPAEKAKEELIFKMKEYKANHGTKEDAKFSFVRATWKAEVFDIVLLLQAVLNGEVSKDCIQPNMKFLNEQARNLKDALNIPGVKAVQS